MTEREYNRIKSANYLLKNREARNATQRRSYAKNAERINAARRERRAD
jgi:hypothetical protein